MIYNENNFKYSKRLNYAKMNVFVSKNNKLQTWIDKG